MLKVMTIVGTRPELIKMSRVIAALDHHTEHILVHTGQNFDYELNQIFFDDLEIREPDYFLEAMGSSPAQTIARVIERSDEILAAEKPDALMLYGDTNSCLAVIAGKRRKVPVFHMEAGNRCFDQRVPEELNRKILDHLSDINLVLTEHARRYLIAEGIRPETIIKTGSHMKEVLSHYMPKIKKSNVKDRMKLKNKKYFLISAHREENVDSDDNLLELIESLNNLAEIYSVPLIVSTHPRTQKRLDKLIDFYSNPRIQFIKPLGFSDYINLQMNALCVISDSGTITEESAILDFPALTIRDTHERPEGMDSGVLVMARIKRETILNAVKLTINNHNLKNKNITQLPADYQNENVSMQILKIVYSYVDYVRRTVWFDTALNKVF